MSNKLFIGGLAWATTEESLRDAFRQFGEVSEVKIIVDHYTGRSRGFGFITYTNAEDAPKALEQLNGTELDGRTIRVDSATDRRSGDGGGGGGGGGGGSKRKMRDLSKGVIYNPTTGNEFRTWVVNNKNPKISAIARSTNLDPTGSWYNKHIRDAWSAVKALGFEYKAGGLTTDPNDIAESKAGANIQADNDTLKAYLLHKEPLKHRDHMLLGQPDTSKHGGPFPAYFELWKNTDPKVQEKKVVNFLRSRTASGMLLSAYRADVVGSPSLELAMTTAAHDRAEAAKEAEKAKAEKTKREKEAVKSDEFYIIPPAGEESLVKDSDNNFKKGTIFVSKQNGDTYYVGQAQGRPKQLFALQLRSMGRGGVTGTNVLSEDELTKLKKVIPDSHWEVWEEFFGDREQYLESLTESQSGWNPASWFRESRKTEKGHYDKARGNLRKLHDSTRPAGSSLAASMPRSGGRQPMGGQNPFPTPGTGRTD
jgi:RNA recognition motif-containing protein